MEFKQIRSLLYWVVLESWSFEVVIMYYWDWTIENSISNGGVKISSKVAKLERECCSFGI